MRLTAAQKSAGNKANNEDKTSPFLFVTPYQSLKSWQKSSFSPVLQGWLILWALTVIFGQKNSCGGQGKDRGSCEDDEDAYWVPEKACLTKLLTLHSKKDYFQCRANEMHVFPWCGCRNVCRRVTLWLVGARRPAGALGSYSAGQKRLWSQTLSGI